MGQQEWEAERIAVLEIPSSTRDGSSNDVYSYPGSENSILAPP